MAKILLVEPAFKNKYPPLALMKISTYHKMLGDNVYFCKGKNAELRMDKWDRIYISTLFTFHWNITVDTICYYKSSVDKISDIYCGGVMATVLSDELEKEHKVTVIKGLLDKPGVLGEDSYIVDTMSPDYSILDVSKNKHLDYTYSVCDSYIAYATRGCVRNCPFCAVPEIEPCFSPYIDIKKQVDYIKDNFGEKKNLLLLDNNVLASSNFDKIIEDIKLLGYEKGATYKTTKNGKTNSSQKYVDFNQGIDARLLTREKCRKLAEIAIRPLRIAFDHADDETIKLYKEKAELAAECGIEHLSNYILFNFDDTPEDLYNRLEINVLLNENFKEAGYKARIWSFPMKYTPIKGEHSKDRKFIGKEWNRKYLRAIQCILNATHGVVGPKKEFFYVAYGKDIDEFLKILAMPEDYIINRKFYKTYGLTDEWNEAFSRLDDDSSTLDFIMNGDLRKIKSRTNCVLKFYV